MKTTESAKAAELTEKLKHCNTDRKMVQKAIYEACVSQVTDEMKAGGFLLIRLQDAHEGVIGIACGKLKETYRLPSFIVTRTEDGKWKGTGDLPAFRRARRRLRFYDRRRKPAASGNSAPGRYARARDSGGQRLGPGRTGPAR